MRRFNRISVVIIAKNAVATIRQCLDSCKDFDEVIIVIDSGTSDDTINVCRSYTNVITSIHPFLGFGKMKQYATSLATNDWILSLDADEVLSTTLIDELANIDFDPQCVYGIKRYNHYKGRHIDACGWNNDYPKRIYHRQFTDFSDQEIHESIKMDGMKLVKINGPLLHYAYENETQLKEKAERYARLYAKENYRKKHATTFTAYYKSAFVFIKDYLLRKGIRYGSDGYTISKYNALGAFLKYKYLAEENAIFNHTLIVTTYNRPDALASVLDSIVLQSRVADQVIIADDGSTSDTAAVIKLYQNKIKNLTHVWQEDDGFRLAAIRNKAINKASGDFISLIDGDMVLHRDFLKTIYYLAKKNTYLQGKRVLLNDEVTQNLISNKRAKIHFWTQGIINRFNTISNLFLSKILSKKYNSIKSVKGCSMHFWKEDAVKINGFNEAFIGWGREDSEFLCRLLNAGVDRKNIILGAVAYHLYHDEAPRAQLPVNDAILENCVAQKTVWCDHGLNESISKSN
jgi:glycosyltransferase involved in cell wall biosynthesis